MNRKNLHGVQTGLLFFIFFFLIFTFFLDNARFTNLFDTLRTIPLETRHYEQVEWRGYDGSGNTLFTTADGHLWSVKGQYKDFNIGNILLYIDNKGTETREDDTVLNLVLEFSQWDDETYNTWLKANGLLG